LSLERIISSSFLLLRSLLYYLVKFAFSLQKLSTKKRISHQYFVPFLLVFRIFLSLAILTSSPKLLKKIIELAWKLNDFLVKINEFLSKRLKEFLSILQNVLNNTFKLVTFYIAIKTSERLKFVKSFYYLLN